MATSPGVQTVFDREFLTIRSRLIDVAAIFDRVDRAEGAPPDDPRPGQIRQAIQILGSPSAGRAEKLQRLFSLPYDETWRSQFNLD